MKKIFSVIVVGIMIFTLKNAFNDEQKNVSENILSENNTEKEVVILDGNSQNNIIINNTESNERTTHLMEEKKLLENKTIAFLGDSLVRGYGNNDNGFDYYLSLELKNTNFINNSKRSLVYFLNSNFSLNFSSIFPTEFLVKFGLI